MESVKEKELSRSQQVLVAELYYMVGQQVELDSMEDAIHVFNGMSTIWMRSNG